MERPESREVKILAIDAPLRKRRSLVSATLAPEKTGVYSVVRPQPDDVR